MFEGIKFIKSSAINDDTKKSYAPMFRRRFKVNKDFSKATLSICGLGYVYSYINGEKTSDDLFTAAVSDYSKTLWYHEYDVTGLLKKGDNIFAAICGNGWYNENIQSGWDFDKAVWRDTPKLIMTLTVDGEQVLCSDDEFVVSLNSPIIYNELRSGEHFDSRLYQPDWNKYDFDDSNWEKAIIDQTPPKGIFRKCECEPIRECAVYPTKKIIKNSSTQYIFDLGQNMSGYIRLNVCQNAGDVLKIRYAEQLSDDGGLTFNHMEDDCFYRNNEFQTDYFICNGKPMVWSPKFAYHGFRYIMIEGIKNPSNSSVNGVFVHQDIEKRSEFVCSDYTLTELFRIGQMASYSNMFYMLTDCPTREKLGWTNDSRASIDQMLTNFKTERLFEKWMVDVRDAMKDDGQLPGIIPTAGWGYQWGNGPVSDGVLFEMAYQTYLHTGRSAMLKDNLPYFEKYLNYLKSLEDENGDINSGLHDWANPDYSKVVPVAFINDVLRADFLRITALSAELNGADKEVFLKAQADLVEKIKTRYINADGTCNIDEQTAVAMLIYYDIYNELEPLKNQLIRLIDERDGHHYCGMVGMRHLLIALNKCGLAETAFQIITSDEYPSHGFWLKHGATTLWEVWRPDRSRNHHMYSDFMSWIIKTILGIAPEEGSIPYKTVHINPQLLGGMTFAKGSVDTVSGKILVDIQRELDKTAITIVVPQGIDAYYKGEKLAVGTNIFKEV